MPGLLIKNLPPVLHRQLKQRARLHHRSMTKEAIAILESELRPVGPVRLPKLYVGKKPLTPEFLERAIREGRA